ncbi:hypothetical protein BD309DRAFT_958734 [Dichomitus squalens]|nr:hypothetical protein BD309DRAFT_958734 [Dichomitus squalens]
MKAAAEPLSAPDSSMRLSLRVGPRGQSSTRQVEWPSKIRGRSRLLPDAADCIRRETREWTAGRPRIVREALIHGGGQGDSTAICGVRRIQLLLQRGAWPLRMSGGEGEVRCIVAISDIANDVAVEIRSSKSILREGKPMRYERLERGSRLRSIGPGNAAMSPSIGQ